MSRDKQNYWLQDRRKPWSRRRVLKGFGVIGLGGAAAALIGCGDDDDDGEPTPGGSTPPAGATQPSAGEPKSGGKFQQATRPWEVSLDPHYTNRPEMIYLWKAVSHPLLELDGNNQVSNDGVAESHELIDQTTISFTLYPGITYHEKAPANGRAFTAEDAKYSIERMKAEDATRATLFAAIASIDVPDASTLVLTLDRPYVPILYFLGSTYNVMVLPEAVEQFGHLDHPDAVIGVGPFVTRNASKDSGATLEKNPNYFHTGLPYLDTVDFVPVQDPAVAIPNAFRAGESDVASLSGSDLEQIQGQYPDIAVTRVGNGGVPYGMFFNHAREPWSDLRIRRAVHLVINRQAVGDAIAGEDFYLVAPVPIPIGEYAIPNEELSQLPGYRANKDEDIAEARSLLQSAGYANDFSDLSFRMISSAQSNYSEQWEIIVPQLQALGAEIDMVPMEHAAFKAVERDKDYDISFSALLVDPEPDALLSVIHHSKGSRNYTNYSNPAIDAIIEAQAGEFDTTRRVDLCREASRALIDDVAYGWTVSQWSNAVVREYIHGYDVNPTSVFESKLTRVWRS